MKDNWKDELFGINSLEAPDTIKMLENASKEVENQRHEQDRKLFLRLKETIQEFEKGIDKQSAVGVIVGNTTVQLEKISVLYQPSLLQICGVAANDAHVLCVRELYPLHLELIELVGATAQKRRNSIGFSFQGQELKQD